MPFSKHLHIKLRFWVFEVKTASRATLRVHRSFYDAKHLSCSISKVPATFGGLTPFDEYKSRDLESLHNVNSNSLFAKTQKDKWKLSKPHVIDTLIVVKNQGREFCDLDT